MSTIDDLRATLGGHAAGVADHHPHDRIVAVRGRVRTVRRRRTGAVLAAAVAVVAAVSASLVVGEEARTPQPAPPSLGHWSPPAVQQSLGYTYRYVTGSSGSETAAVSLDAATTPLLVSWASAGDDVKITGPDDGEVFSSTAGPFQDFTLVPAGQPADFTAYADDVALAVYELDESAPPPEGVTRDGITFRQNVGGADLLGASIGDLGQGEVTAGFASDPARVSVVFFCSGGGDRTWTHVSVDGTDAAAWGPGCTDATFDPGGSGSMTFGREARGGEQRVRLWVTEGEHGPRVDVPGMRLGVAVYAPSEVAARVGGQPVFALTEHDGHVWRLEALRQGQPGQTEVTVHGLDEGPRLVRAVFSGAGDRQVVTLLDGEVDGRFAIGAGGGGALGVLDGAADTAGIRVPGGPAPGVRLGLAVYSKIG